MGEQFADVNVVDRVTHGGGGVMVWAGMCYGQRTQVHFIDGTLNAQRYHVWDALDRRIRQRVPVPANIQQLHTAIEEEWTNIPQATINNLINSM